MPKKRCERKRETNELCQSPEVPLPYAQKARLNPIVKRSRSIRSDDQHDEKIDPLQWGSTTETQRRNDSFHYDIR